jgi:hypothetical protein
MCRARLYMEEDVEGRIVDRQMEGTCIVPTVPTGVLMNSIYKLKTSFIMFPFPYYMLHVIYVYITYIPPSPPPVPFLHNLFYPCLTPRPTKSTINQREVSTSRGFTRCGY